MNKVYKIYRPHIAWMFKLEENLSDCLLYGTDPLVEFLLEKYEITYDEIDLEISTEPIENYDVKIKYIIFEQNILKCEYNGDEIYFTKIFRDHFNWTEDKPFLYMKVVPLPKL